MTKRRLVYRIILIVSVFLILSNTVTAEEISHQLINMNFKGADLRDVLRTIAELAGVNLVTDGSVQGVITVHLKDISFEEALNLITRTHGLAFNWDGNTVLVARPERIEAMYTNTLTENVEIENADPSAVKNIATAIYPDLNIQLDEENSQIIMVGNGDEVNQVLKLIKKLDIPREEVIQVFKVNYKQPGKIRDSLIEILPELKIQLDKGNNQLIFSGRKEDVERAFITAEKLDSRSDKVTEIVTINYGEIENIQQVISKLHPELSLQQNKLRQELIIRGRRDEVGSVLAMVKSLDRPRRQVIIEARIEEISSTELTDIGLSPNINTITFNKDGNSEFSWPQLLKMLEEKGVAQTLANPRLLTLNGEEAKLLIGDRIPIVVEEVKEGEVTRTVEYIEAGINLKFKPWITTDNYINLEICPQVSGIGESTYNNLPTINTREAETRIRLRDGETFAIGGLIQDDIIESISKVPLLSEIPILGEIFKSKSTNNIKTEVIIFITPYILEELDFEILHYQEGKSDYRGRSDSLELNKLNFKK